MREQSSDDCRRILYTGEENAGESKRGWTFEFLKRIRAFSIEQTGLRPRAAAWTPVLAGSIVNLGMARAWRDKLKVRLAEGEALLNEKGIPFTPGGGGGGAVWSSDNVK